MTDFSWPFVSLAPFKILIEKNRAYHLSPIWLAVRDHGVMFTVIKQGQDVLILPEGRPPTIILIGDDGDASFGPGGFHSESLLAIAATLDAAVVISSVTQPELYWAGAAVAVACRRHVAIIETRPEQEWAWIAFLRSQRPGLRLLVGTAEGGAQ